MTDRAVISLEGEWDFSRRAELRSLLQPARNAREVILDLSSTTFLDSSALAEFATIHVMRSKDGHRPMHFVVCSDQLRRLFQIVRLDELFPIFESRAHAVAAMHMASM